VALKARARRFAGLVSGLRSFVAKDVKVGDTASSNEHQLRELVRTRATYDNFPSVGSRLIPVNDNSRHLSVINSDSLIFTSDARDSAANGLSCYQPDRVVPAYRALTTVAVVTSTNGAQRGALFGKLQSPSESWLSEFQPEGGTDNLSVRYTISVGRASAITQFAADSAGDSEAETVKMQSVYGDSSSFTLGEQARRRTSGVVDVLQPPTLPITGEAVHAELRDLHRRTRPQKLPTWEQCSGVKYRQLNLVTRMDAHPLPRIDNTLDTMTGARWFATFNLRASNHQGKVADEDMDKSAFTCLKVMFRYRNMPFGLCNVGATFQRLIHVVLSGLNLDICLVYLNDIVTFQRQSKSLTASRHSLSPV